MEERRSVEDDSGHREDTISRTIDGQTYTTITETSPFGSQSVKEDFKNMSPGETLMWLIETKLSINVECSCTSCWFAHPSVHQSNALLSLAFFSQRKNLPSSAGGMLRSDMDLWKLTRSMRIYYTTKWLMLRGRRAKKPGSCLDSTSLVSISAKNLTRIARQQFLIRSASLVFIFVKAPSSPAHLAFQMVHFYLRHWIYACQPLFRAISITEK